MLTMRQKMAVTGELQNRYQKAKKREKTTILDEFTKLTGYNRSYLARTLRKKKVLGYLTVCNKRIKYVAGDKRRKKKRYYDHDLLIALKRLWKEADYICSKRLAPFLGEFIPVLEKHGEIRLDPKVKEKLRTISAATIDRLLAPVRKRHQIKGRSATRPGSLLKKNIPIRTYSEWDDRRPGFFEVDLVSHDGGSYRGDFIQSLQFTDIAICWTEMIAVKNKAQRWVFEGIREIRNRLPFPILGFDSDNGSEFINDELIRYCEKEHITFTRARPYRKNDSCFIEQKNWSVIRRTVGYGRHDTEEELRVLNQLYSNLRLYVNYFQPVRKLIHKERMGSRIKKSYDVAKTPYRRVLSSPHIPDEIKMNLTTLYDKLNPAELKREISRLQNELYRLNSLKQNRDRETVRDRKPQGSLEYISN